MLYKKSDGKVEYRLGDDVPPDAVAITPKEFEKLPDPGAHVKPLTEIENMLLCLEANSAPVTGYRLGTGRE